MTSLGSNTLAGNRFLNLFLSSLTDVFSALVYYYGVQKMGRKKTYIISGIIMALSTAAIGIFQYSENLQIKFCNSIDRKAVYLHFYAK